MEQQYCFSGSENVITPALIYYRSLIEENTKTAIRMAGGADRLWPHMKSHKMADVIRISLMYGITRFKCATIAEAEVAASCGAEQIVIAYPLVGPNIGRFVQLTGAFPKTHFYAIGDDRHMLRLLGEEARAAGICADVLVDVNMGMNRTGVPMECLEAFCDDCAGFSGISLRGFHCYDGHRTEPDYEKRMEHARGVDQILKETITGIRIKHPDCQIVIVGGSPSFPCHLDFEGAYLSPGTLFIYDYGYSKKYPDLPFVPAAAILTRVVSRPREGFFTIDTGCKAIASDPQGVRGLLLGVGHCEPVLQSEEHWTFRMLPGYEEECPQVGKELFVIPTHICPTSALYDAVTVVENGQITDHWPVTARNRKITY